MHFHLIRNFVSYLVAIKEMKKYGKKLTSSGIDKGAQVEELAKALKEKLEHFLLRSYSNKPRYAQIDQFKIEFTLLAHSKETEMEHHRKYGNLL